LFIIKGFANEQFVKSPGDSIEQEPLFSHFNEDMGSKKRLTGLKK